MLPVIDKIYNFRHRKECENTTPGYYNTDTRND